MKRRNREQLARMRTIQENHLSKPYQRAMDLVQRKTGLSYRFIRRAYQISARPGSTRVDLSSFVITGFEVRTDGIAEVEITDTGRRKFPGLYWESTAK